MSLHSADIVCVTTVYKQHACVVIVEHCFWEFAQRTIRCRRAWKYRSCQFEDCISAEICQDEDEIVVCITVLLRA